ncbi:helix-turn-helix domain protein [Pseudoxanthomonas suwonensis 11-1]|uniref:Helix-turn-helix domain protein n=1 Tax=Pseudoxanthomonas suwonensis (strain 11-1) TaxID=743721 RepID=E6WRH7_PSEUU|nr:helix-turn-helix transcriptional regulator [Pseudoxanthomonas suwonensis]ADV26708.1 helix-turn-helix domain protein [Pseudoxanthomonas suwonensis 11-1]
MSALSIRIRKARLSARLSQAELARRVGVKRSAVTQWEHPFGTTPNMHHLLQIAVEAGVSAEWLATARGAMRPDAGDATGAERGEHAHDEAESDLLMRFRRLPAQKRRIALRILDALAG